MERRQKAEEERKIREEEDNRRKYVSEILLKLELVAYAFLLFKKKKLGKLKWKQREN